MQMLTQVVPLSASEQQLLQGWQDPPAWTAGASAAEPPGRGCFLLKVGGRPGIPMRVRLTASEHAINDTNKRWHQTSRISTQQTEQAEPLALSGEEL
jgi:hypothetical protein